MAPLPNLDFQLFVETAVDLVCRIGMDHRTTYLSPSCHAITGWHPEEITGWHAAQIIHPDDMPTLMAAAANRVAGGEGKPTAVRIRQRSGEWIWLEMRGSILRDEAGQPQEFLVIMRDISERKRLEEELRSIALTDGLTGVANRRAFDQDVEREWKRVLREGSQTSLLLLDVDHFKAFNDYYGHRVGDDCLRAVAHTIHSTLRRPIDRVARYGGEEFAVILPGADMEDALIVAEEIRVAIEALKIRHRGNADVCEWVTASIGVATALARHGGTMKMPESLLMAADSALYKAKLRRNCIATAMLVASPELAYAS